MHSRDEIFKWVTEVLEREFQFDRSELSLETHLIDDLDLDSIDAIDLTVRLEGRTGSPSRRRTSSRSGRSRTWST